ncbi:hypothetical protein ACFL0A_01615 [Patescibacteria group bacterium]
MVSAAPALKNYVDDPLILTKEERDELASFDKEIFTTRQQIVEMTKQIARTQQAKISRLREIATEKGIFAKELENLRSSSGDPYVEQEREKRFLDYGGIRVAVDYGCRRALATIKIGEAVFPLQWAYYCSWCGGWIKGDPNKVMSHMPLSVITQIPARGHSQEPSTMLRDFCRICGKDVGISEERLQFAKSFLAKIQKEEN